MSKEILNDGSSVHDATPATDRLFASIPVGAGTPIPDDDENNDSNNEEEEEEGQEEGQEPEEKLKVPKSPKEVHKEEEEEEADENEEEENEEEEEGEDSEIVGALVEEFGEVELESTSFETEREATIAYTKALSKKEYEKGKDEGITELFNVFPEAKQLVEHLHAGYSIDSFLKEVNVPDYASINLEEASDEQKERLYRTFLSEKGNDEDEIEEMLEIAKDSGKLDERASKAKNFLVDKYKKQVEEKKVKEKEAKEAEVKKIEEQNKKVADIIKSGNLEAAKINDAQAKALEDFIADGEGRAKTWNDLSLNKRLLIEYLVATDFKDLNFSQKDPAKKVGKAIKVKKASTNKVNLSSSGGESSKGLDVKKLFNKNN